MLLGTSIITGPRAYDYFFGSENDVPKMTSPTGRPV